MSIVRSLCCLAIAVGAMGATPCAAQTRVTSFDDLRRELAAGDRIVVVREAGEPVAGRLLRFGDAGLDVRPVGGHATQGTRLRDITIPLDAIRSLERRRDSVADGARLGAFIGAGVGGAMFVVALAVDRNEVDEWAPLYAGMAATSTAIGALAGWGLDATTSKPHIRFDVPSGKGLTITVRPLPSRSPGIGLAVSLSR